VSLSKIIPRRSTDDTKADIVARMGDRWCTAAQLAVWLDMSPAHVSKQLLEMLAAGIVEREMETDEDVRARIYFAKQEARAARVPYQRMQGPPRRVFRYRVTGA
jgi:predicted transcriptional regulator